ncbi:DUF1259 domain-containing protein [Actinacidiphila glaucinigra]|uniref:DUF1259 domain-containing protein n=1 Tax=Actinacidiphila glaucinigra TaxID=235986 RepID=UPI0033AC727E
MMREDRQQDTHPQAGASRRHLLAAATLAPLLGGAISACAPTGTSKQHNHPSVMPVRTALTDWKEVALALGRTGDIRREFMYHTGLPRRDLNVVSQGVTVKPGLALGSHVSFVRYADGNTLLMGDVVVTEKEMQSFADVLHERKIEQTAIHKHLLSQTPEIWWVHVHAHGKDPVAIAKGLRAALDRTGAPPPGRPDHSKPRELDMDVAAIDKVMGVKGGIDDGVYKNTFVRRETIIDAGMVLPPGLGSTSAINYQPLGNGRAAVSGDCAMIASEVQNVLAALRKAGCQLVELHNHGLVDEPRLFFVHFWAVGDAVKLAKGIRKALDATNVKGMAVEIG